MRVDSRNTRSAEFERILADAFRKLGEPGGDRTRDHRIKSAMLYQLSYRPGKKEARPDFFQRNTTANRARRSK